MRVVEVTYNKPANLLIKSLQEHCEKLMASIPDNGISTLKDLEKEIWHFAESQHDNYPKCNLNKLEVISRANILHESYNLLYNGEISMISIFARPDDYEMAFRDYDAIPAGEKLLAKK
jgi:hypothetical protein